MAREGSSSPKRGHQKFIDGLDASHRAGPSITVQIDERGEVIPGWRDALKALNPKHQAECFSLIREGLSEHLLDYSSGKINRIETDAAAFLGFAIAEFERGHIPPWLRNHRKGNSAQSFAAESQIGDALRYRDYCKRRRIDDDDPLLTIILAFGVSEDTVLEWPRKYKATPDPEKLTRLDLSNYVGDGTPESIENQFVKQMMEHSGKHYRNRDAK